jgi:hypothetical protein
MDALACKPTNDDDQVMPMTDTAQPIGRDLPDVRVVRVPARAVRDSEVEPDNALRMIKHEMYRRSTNPRLRVERRSVAAQTLIERYGQLGQPVRNTTSGDALTYRSRHPLAESNPVSMVTINDWVDALTRLRNVGYLTARDDNALKQLEHRGITGPDQYAEAKIGWAENAQPPLLEFAGTETVQT